VIFTCTQALESWLIECITDQHGNHVVQKAVEIIGQSNLNLILGHCLGKVNQRQHLQEKSANTFYCWATRSNL
jgi:hypothetical protein